MQILWGIVHLLLFLIFIIKNNDTKDNHQLPVPDVFFFLIEFTRFNSQISVWALTLCFNPLALLKMFFIAHKLSIAGVFYFRGASRPICRF